MLNDNSNFNDAWNLVWKLRFQFLSKARTEKSRYINHILPALGNIPLQEITPIMLMIWKSDLLERGLAPQTIHHIVGLVRRIFNSLIEWKIFPGENPASCVKQPVPDNKRQRFLTRNEAHLLLEETRKYSLQTWQISLLSISTGMRAGEIFNIKGEHVNLCNKSIRVIDTKNDRNRTVYLPKSAELMLSEIKIKNNYYVFTDRNGLKLKRISKTFPRIVNNLGFNKNITDRRDKVVFHSLRHTFASWLVQSGAPLQVVAELLGHTTLEMTKRYAHLDDKTKSVTIEKLNMYI
ncbi:tyrosine-type recombinase/integrase [Desulfobulbus elongatus]|uniref:tyrosine-type recombinase/integrase n=1 Tax=Desulfobulbus elongatus TaxID=53332 RepID=UPI000A050E30|nr:site-specific integrase [Desulfobulbus elongatus]